jgi:hypothetical protein
MTLSNEQSWEMISTIEHNLEKTGRHKDKITLRVRLRRTVMRKNALSEFGGGVVGGGGGGGKQGVMGRAFDLRLKKML